MGTHHQLCLYHRFHGGYCKKSVFLLPTTPTTSFPEKTGDSLLISFGISSHSLPFLYQQSFTRFSLPFCSFSLGFFSVFLISFFGQMSVAMASASSALQPKAVEIHKAFENSKARLAPAAGFGPLRSSIRPFWALHQSRYADNCCSPTWFLKALVFEILDAYNAVPNLLFSSCWISTFIVLMGSTSVKFFLHLLFFSLMKEELLCGSLSQFSRDLMGIGEII